MENNNTDDVFGTFEIRINNNKDKAYLFKYIYSYKHIQNILTILVTYLFKDNNPDYKYFLDYRVVRACISDTKGSKEVVDQISYIKDKYKDNQLYNNLLQVGRNLKTHNIVMIIRKYKKDFSNYFRNLKDYQTNPSKYTGEPSLPKARKLSKLDHYAIPLDNSKAWTIKNDMLGINLNDKMRYFYLGKIIQNGKILNKEIQSISIKMRLKEIYISFTYKVEKQDYYSNNNESLSYNTINAGIDIGLNNLISLFIDDKQSKSIIVDGAKYKHYNSKFNRLIAKINQSIDEQAIEYKTILKPVLPTKEEPKEGTDKTSVYIPIKWTKRGHRLKRYISFLYRKRNGFFETEFHKISKRLVEYLKLNNVKKLVLSKSLASLMNNGKCNLRKSVKQNFIQIPFIKLIHYIEEKAIKNAIEVIFIDEAYTSKTSCISGDVLEVQTKSKTGKPSIANEFKGTRAKRGLFKDIVLNKIWNADLNGAVNHIKVAFSKSSFQWLDKHLFKLCNPYQIKSASDFLLFLNRDNDAGKAWLSNTMQTIK
ncbi:MAG TPA: transposase [Flavobacteriia bacterium]|nr:transposase [Flavobacteriia bacterium]